MTSNSLIYSNFSGHSMLWATAKNRLLCYKPLRVFCLSTMGHSAGSCSALLATAQILVPHNGPQHMTSFEYDKNRIPCASTSYLCAHSCVFTCIWSCTHVVMSLRAHGCVSTCTRPCIPVHVVMYPYARGCVSTCTWPCIHPVIYPLAHGREPRAEFGYEL